MHVTKPTRPKEKTQIKDKKQDIMDKLDSLYGKSESEDIYKEIEKLIDKYRGKMKTRLIRKSPISEEDIILTAYGDSIQEDGVPSLHALHEFLKEYLKGYVTYLHLHTLNPYSSDDGFAVMDYYIVKPELGDWSSLEELSKDFKLIFDAVINHVSSRSNIFQKYLKGDDNYQDFFIEVKSSKDYEKAQKSKGTPLTTKFLTNDGEKNIWTTFGEDEIDLNYKNKDVLLMVIDVLLFYISKDARALNLYGSNYIWKKKNTECFALEESQKIIQLFRDILDMVSPDTLIVTQAANNGNKDGSSKNNETESDGDKNNASDKEEAESSEENENDGTEGNNEKNKDSENDEDSDENNKDEKGSKEEGKDNSKDDANLIMKKSPIASLILNAFLTGSTQKLLKWMESQENEGRSKIFINSIYERGGIDLNSASEYLEDKEIEEMVLITRENGGYVSYKKDEKGKEKPRMLNISLFDALSGPRDDDELKIDKFIAAQALFLSMNGIPNIHINNILASRNYYKGVEETGRFEAINREKFELSQLKDELQDEKSIRYKVFNDLCYLIKTRSKEKSFGPNSSQEIISSTDGVFSSIRTSKDKEESVLVLCNVSDKKQSMEIDFKDYGIEDDETLTELTSEENYKIKKGILNIDLEPYQFMWLK